MLTQTVTLLAMGFGLGLLHALDPDHVLAVANLNDARAGRRGSLAFSARWALGHGAALLMIGALVLLAGLAVPTGLSAWAEYLVGFVLIGLGMGALWALWAGEAPLQVHRHGADGAHLHVTGLPAHHGRRALLVGLLHGTAGSASLLALTPLVTAPTPWIGMAYLLLFGAGVLTAMIAFGGLLGAGLGRLRQGIPSLASGLRATLALAAMALGITLLRGGI
jgi:ABC-type nickel/cobalt efflux system permease component RcnA